MNSSTTKKKPVNYVNNKDFHEAIVEYRKKVKKCEKEGKDPPRIPDFIGSCILKIAQGLSNKPCFSSYSFKEEMISDAIENAILYFHNYNPEMGQNPFAYFSQISYFAFLRRISREEEIRYSLYKNFQETIVNSYDTGLLTDSEGNHVLPTQLYDNINDFMERFERKKQDKKLKRKKTK